MRYPWRPRASIRRFFIGASLAGTAATAIPSYANSPVYCEVQIVGGAAATLRECISHQVSADVGGSSDACAGETIELVNGCSETFQISEAAWPTGQALSVPASTTVDVNSASGELLGQVRATSTQQPCEACASTSGRHGVLFALLLAAALAITSPRRRRWTR